MKSATSTRSRASAPAQRSSRQEEAQTDPGLQLRGDAPLGQSGWRLRSHGPRLHRLRPEVGGGATPRREDFDGETLRVRRTAHEGQIVEGTKTDHGEPDAGRVVPVPATLAWMLEAQLQVSEDSELLFTTPTGRMWGERNFYRGLWRPAQEASGVDIRPHECRHSYVTHLRAAGVNDADLAEIAGHRVETMIARYTMPSIAAMTLFGTGSAS